MFHKTLAIAVRALRVDARRNQSHLMRLGFCAIVLLNLFVVQQTAFAFSAPGLRLFQSIVYTTVVCASLAVPLLFATAVTEEKEERTLSLLKVADVRPLTLLTGKFLPRLTSALLILLAQFPFTLLAVTLGGVSFSQILAAYVAVGAYLLGIAGFAILCSVPFQASGNAIGAAMLALLAYHMIPMLLHQWSLVARTVSWLGSFAGFVTILTEPLIATNVFRRLMVILNVGFNGSLFSAQVVSNLLGGIVFFLLAWGSFEFFNPEVEGVPVSRGKRRFFRKTRLSWRSWDAAIAWKEFHYSVGGIRYLVAKTLIYAAAIAFIAAANAEWKWTNLDRDDVGAFAAGLMFFCFLPAEITLVVGRLLHPEVREKTLSTLVLLPVSCRRILYNKFLGASLSFLPALGYLVLGLILAPDILEKLAFHRWREEEMLAAAHWISQALLFWSMLLLFSLSMNPGWALCTALFAQYVMFLVVMLIAQLARFWLGLPWSVLRPAAWILPVAALLLAYFLHLGTMVRIREIAAEE
jgi:ABC-type transport system involved in multi-copper enzyme maturation permease subunit